ncbi:hypothetical protein GALL_531970 [mine drainage metagenome]|uniref:Uncharacterized protein n=1 Tax=mine drainage metagenome TaxID=410659 RepID=A0A1J5P3J8_9ZZZZ
MKLASPPKPVEGSLIATARGGDAMPNIDLVKRHD